MEWVLRLVGTGINGQSRSFDVIGFSRPDGLGDIANLGPTLADGKRLLAEVQQVVVAAQGDDQRCRPCGRRCHLKNWRRHRIATLFGEVRVSLPWFVCAGCGRTETGLSSPSHSRSAPGTAAPVVRAYGKEAPSTWPEAVVHASNFFSLYRAILSGNCAGPSSEGQIAQIRYERR